MSSRLAFPFPDSFGSDRLAHHSAAANFASAAVAPFAFVLVASVPLAVVLADPGRRPDSVVPLDSDRAPAPSGRYLQIAPLGLVRLVA